MATVFPSTLPDFVLSDPRRSAEISVYNALRDQLGDEYYVFYSSPWLGTKPDGSEIDGEADFLIARADRGILSVEVKGGRVAIDRDNQWTSTDRYGFTRRIKDPVHQARSSKHEILKKLKKSNVWKSRYISAVHGVILPDVSDSGIAEIRPDMPQEIFAFCDDMRTLDLWVDSRMSKGSATAQLLGPDGIRALEVLLSLPIQFEKRAASAIRSDLDEILLKTEEQVWILEELKDNKRMKIAGAAGTGKTILALEKALSLARDGKRSLLLCFNRPLARWLKGVVCEEPLIKAVTFGVFSREVARSAGLDPDSFTLEELAKNLIDNFGNSMLERFDAVIVDEGQDFEDPWLESLEILLRDSTESVFYVFYDDNQNVARKPTNWLESLPAATRRLTANFRNTQAIFKEALPWYRGILIRAVGPAGLPVVHHESEGGSDLRKLVLRRIRNLISNENLSPVDISVLFPDQRFLSSLFPEVGEGLLGEFYCRNAEERSPDFLTADTIRRFKGLESPAVILVLTPEVRLQHDLVYTGLTRPQALLEIVSATT